MKEMQGKSIRHRTIDHSKPMQIIKDVSELYKKEDNMNLNWVKDPSGENKNDQKSILEAEIKKIIELFDKKKSILIPKVEAQDKSQTQATSEGKFSTHVVSYKQSEFERPKHYIIYSERKSLDPKEKDYEASVVDLNFLKFENYFISVDELERIISALENDINKGEMIPIERVKEIVYDIIPDKKQHADKIIRYWQTRREEFKKSLLRKFWKDQKYTDKYLVTTFRRRGGEKMKTRRNKKNELEGLLKLKEIKDSTQKYLINIISMMKEREVMKRNVLILQQMEFEAEVNSFRSEKVNVDEKYRELIKTFPKPIKHPHLYSPEKEQKMENKENLPKREISIITGEKTDSTLPKLSELQKKPHKRPRLYNEAVSSIQKAVQPASLISKTETQKKIKEDQPTSEFILKHRIRYNRLNNLTIDRYIQHPTSFSPFDDDFNLLINKFKIYNEDFVYNRKKTSDFDSLYEDYLKGKFSGIILTDSEDDLISFNSQVRSFSSSFKQFLKHKRSHPEISTML